MESNEKIITLIIDKLTKTYGKGESATKALKGIDLEVSRGDFIAIMGASGSGKTTLLNIISTIDTKTTGSVIIDGQDISNLDNKELAAFRREKLGFIFQDFMLLDTLTGYENIALALSINKIPYEEISKRIKDLSSLLGIEGILAKYPYEMSGGEKQRVSATRAMIMNPSLVLADEPTGALDSKSSRVLLEALKKMNQERSATIMMVTHDAFAASFANQVLFIKDGKIYNHIHNETNNQKLFFDEIMQTISRGE